MKTKEIKIIVQRLRSYLNSGRLWSAMDLIESMLVGETQDWKLREQLDKLKETYSLLTKYTLDGMLDPNRASLLNDIKNRLEQLAQIVERKKEIVESPQQYYGILRYEQSREDGSLLDAFDAYIKSSGQLDSIRISDRFVGDKDILIAERQLYESIDRVFRLLWVTFPLSHEEIVRIETTLNSATAGEVMKATLVSALFLGALEFLDVERLKLLSRLYHQNDDVVSVRSLTAVMLLINKYRDSLPKNFIAELLTSMRQKASWKKDLKIILLLLAKTRDTERITKKITEEVMPSLLSLQSDPALKDSILNINSESSLDADFNPEWFEKIEQSGISDKLRELSDLQEDGADVMLASFSHMKGFRFFHEIGHWFIPFTPEHPDVVDVTGSTPNDLIEFIAEAPTMCDSDRYSLVMSLDRIPSAQRRSMISQFKEQSQHFAEIFSTVIDNNAEIRRRLARSFIQDLYRFFNLYQRKQEFNNPIQSIYTLFDVDILRKDIDGDFLSAIAEFYFKRKYYPEALSLYDSLARNNSENKLYLQKKGFCYQQLGEISLALDCYDKSRLIGDDSDWLLRRLAYCYHKLGNFKEALAYYRIITANNPEDVRIAIQSAKCSMELKHYDDALKDCFRAEFYASGKQELDVVVRLIAKNLLLTGQFDRSEEYFLKAMKSALDPYDYYYLGHLQLINGLFRDAENYYMTFLTTANQSFQYFDERMNSDRQFLIKSGVEEETLDILIDHVHATYIPNSI